MKVFVSYSRKDDKFVQRLAADLEARGIDAWVDTEDIKLANEDIWRAAIANAIEASAAVILVLSPDSVTSSHVTQEALLAADEGKRIVPIVHRVPATPPASLKLQLAGVQLTDFAQRPYADALDELVHRLPGVVPPPPPPPPPHPRPARDRGRIAAATAGALVVLAVVTWLILRRDQPTAGATVEPERASCSADDCEGSPIHFALSSGDPGDIVTTQVVWPDGDRGAPDVQALDSDGGLEWRWHASRSDPVGTYHVVFGFPNGAHVDREFEVVPVGGPSRAVQAVAAALIAGDWEAAARIDHRLEGADEQVIADSYSSYEVRRWIPRDAEWTDSAGALEMTGGFVGYDRDADATQIDCELWSTTDGGATMRSDSLRGSSGEPLGHTEGGRMSTSAASEAVAQLCVKGGGETVEPPPPTTVSPGATVLQVGSQGDSVRELQSLLNAANYGAGEVDGLFGTETSTALQSFESDLGGDVDGRIEQDGQEWRELESRAASGQCRLPVDEDGITVVAGEGATRIVSFTASCTGGAELTIGPISVVDGGSVAGSDCASLGNDDGCDVEVTVDEPIGAVEVVLQVEHDGIGSPTRATVVEERAGGATLDTCRLSPAQCISTTTPEALGS